jgi:hypothetical protein
MQSRNERRLTIKLSALILTITMGLDGTGVAQEIISVPEDLPNAGSGRPSAQSESRSDQAWPWGEVEGQSEDAGQTSTHGADHSA